MISSAIDMPLDFSERIHYLPYIDLIQVEPLSHQETNSFVKEALQAVKCQIKPEPGNIYDLFAGSVGLTLDACKLLSRMPIESGLKQLPVQRAEDIAEVLKFEFQNQLVTYYLALISAIVDEEWPVRAIRLPASASQKEPSKKTSKKNSTDADPYSKLQNLVVLNFGIILCEMLASADMSRDVIVDQENLAQHLSKSKLLLHTDTSLMGFSIKPFNFEKKCKKLLRFQKRLLIEPPLIAVNDSRTKITLWSSANAPLAEQIKAGVEGIIDAFMEGE
jgi:hypothetical protein